MKKVSGEKRQRTGGENQDSVTMEIIKDTPGRLGAVITPNHAFVSASAGTD